MYLEIKEKVIEKLLYYTTSFIDIYDKMVSKNFSMTNLAIAS